MEGIATHVWVVSVPVTNFDRALGFYRDLLCFPLRLEARSFNWIELGPDEPLCKIGLYQANEGTPRRPPVRTGIILDTDDINMFYARLTNRGIQFPLPPEKQPWGGVVAEFLDPDGNQLEVVQDAQNYARPVS